MATYSYIRAYKSLVPRDCQSGSKRVSDFAGLDSMHLGRADLEFSK
jgi:hypothetical protein